MATKADFVTRCALELPNCPEPLIGAMAVEVFRDFCRRTHAWRRWFDFEYEAGLEEYPIPLAVGQAVAVVTALLADDGERMLLPRSISSPGVEDFNDNARTGLPVEFLLLPPSTIKLLPVPDSGGLLFAEAALMPTSDAEDFPDEVFLPWEDTLARGVTGRMQMQPSVQWSNPPASAINMQMYQQGVAQATRQNLRRGTLAQMPKRPSSFI